MNWDAIGAISEILAAIAVVVTLIYLAKQIRQNSQTVEISALRDTTEQWNRWSEVLATSPQLAEIVTPGKQVVPKPARSRSSAVRCLHSDDF